MQDSLAALVVSEPDPVDAQIARMEDCAIHLADDDFQKFQALVEAVDGSRGPGSQLAPIPPGHFLRPPGGAPRSIRIVGQDPVTCRKKSVSGRKAFGLFDTGPATEMKATMFCYAAGWNPATIDALLMECGFDNCLSKKLKAWPSRREARDLNEYLTRACRHAAARNGEAPCRGLPPPPHLPPFDAGARMRRKRPTSSTLRSASGAWLRR